MNTLKNFGRMALITLLAVASLTLMLALPENETDLASFAWSLLWSKSLAFGGFFLMGRLLRAWDDEEDTEQEEEICR